MTAIAAEVAKRKKQRAEQPPKGDDEDDDTVVENLSSGHKDEGNVCFQYRSNCTCEYGDRCVFEHVTPGQSKAKACRVRKKNLSTDPIPGALVMAPNNYRHIPLRGVLGQIVGEGIGGRHRIQLHVDANGDALTEQLDCLAFELGMFVGPDCGHSKGQ